MERKRILFIMPALPGGGAEKVLIDILKNFNQEKFLVTLILIRWKGVYLNQIPTFVHVISLDRFIPSSRLLYNRFTSNFWKRYSILRAIGFDRFYTIVSFMEGESVFYHSFVYKRGQKNVSWVHTDLKENHWSSRFFKSQSHEENCYSKMNQIVFVSKKAETQFQNEFNIKIDSRVLYNLIDSDNICRQSNIESVPRNKYFTVCNVGRLCEQKRQDRLIEAISILHKQHGLRVECWILGKGDLLESLQQLSKQLNVDDRVHFLGFKDNPYPFMASSDAFVLSSDTEGYPLVLAEAVCIGKPIVSTDVTGTKEVLGDDCGFICSTNSDEIADAIFRLATNPDLLTDQKNKSLKRAKSFDVENVMTQIYDVLS